MARRAETCRIAAALLSGGEASRYGGRPKGLLEIAPGLSILHHEIDQLRDAGLEDIILVANQPEPYLHLGLPVVPDLRPGRGPLAGIEAALTYYSNSHEATLFLPCDLPAIAAGEIARLRDSFLSAQVRLVVAVTGLSFVQPLCSVVHNGLLPAVTAALEEGEGSPGRLWRRWEARAVRFEDPAPFFNVNSPEDLAEWLARREENRDRNAERS
jgi:molybdopterin-guanine dinucleotide biosynthesis protein A